MVFFVFVSFFIKTKEFIILSPARHYKHDKLANPSEQVNLLSNVGHNSIIRSLEIENRRCCYTSVDCVCAMQSKHHFFISIADCLALTLNTRVYNNKIIPTCGTPEHQ